MNEIRQWLGSNRDYFSGLKLFQPHCKSKVLFEMLRQGETKFNKAKLYKHLVEIANQVVEKTVYTPKEILTDFEYKTAGDDVRKLKAQATQLFKENAKRHNDCNMYLQLAMDEAERFRKDISKYYNTINSCLKKNKVDDLVHAILDTDDELAALYYKIDYWKIYKKLPSETAEIKINTTDKYFIKRTIQNLSAQISKLKKNEKRKNEIPNLKQQKEVLEKKLDELI
jgi:hypothetical protein